MSEFGLPDFSELQRVAQQSHAERAAAAAQASAQALRTQRETADLADKREDVRQTIEKQIKQEARTVADGLRQKGIRPVVTIEMREVTIKNANFWRNGSKVKVKTVEAIPGWILTAARLTGQSGTDKGGAWKNADSYTGHALTVDGRILGYSVAENEFSKGGTIIASPNQPPIVHESQVGEDGSYNDESLASGFHLTADGFVHGTGIRSALAALSICE